MIFQRLINAVIGQVKTDKNEASGRGYGTSDTKIWDPSSALKFLEIALRTVPLDSRRAKVSGYDRVEASKN